MKDSNKTPLAFFITFRAYGTWLHGDPRGSTSRFKNRYRKEFHPENLGWQEQNKKLLKQEPVRLTRKMREVVLDSIYDTVKKRKWILLAQNIRTSHSHIVVDSKSRKGKPVLSALKANATRSLRDAGVWVQDYSPWAARGSARPLWDQDAVDAVIDYVLNRQGRSL